MRATVLLGAAIAIAAAGACKGGGDSDKPLPSRELVATHATVVDAEFDIKLPKAAKPEGAKKPVAPNAPQPVAGQGETRWMMTAGGDTLDITVQLAAPSPMQNASNFEESAGRRIGRAEETADGWSVTSYSQNGDFINSRRMVKKGERALFCSASVIWSKPAHDPKRTEWVESICHSMTPTKL